MIKFSLKEIKYIQQTYEEMCFSKYFTWIPFTTVSILVYGAHMVFWKRSKPEHAHLFRKLLLRQTLHFPRLFFHSIETLLPKQYQLNPKKRVVPRNFVFVFRWCSIPRMKLLQTAYIFRSKTNNIPRNIRIKQSSKIFLDDSIKTHGS